ncbi:MAG: trypsin-like peptidase domain-containing protein [Planctomycetota bacterium]
MSTKHMAAAAALLAAAAFAPAGPPERSPQEIEKALATVEKQERERVLLAAKLADTVCAVFQGGGGGSGVIFTADGLVLSNFHVTRLSPTMRIGLNDQRIHPSVVLGVDPSGDLSVLRLTEERTWPFTPLGDSDAMEQGDWVYAMGNPFLLATDFTPTVTLGVVSRINVYQPGSMRGQLLYPDCIQTDASINPGNSGGPLFNFAGEVVGINGRVSLRERGRVNIGVGYAISSNQIKKCLPDLRAGLIVQHGTLNATVNDLQDGEWPGGVRVTFTQIMKPGCAADAGIQPGDALITFQGIPITETNQFVRLISVLPKGRRVHLRYARLGEDSWEEREVKLFLDGIPLVRAADAARRKTPKVYIEHEIDRTFGAARKALQPITGETRTGTRTVAGRDAFPIEERFAQRTYGLTIGDRVIAIDAEGGTDRGKPMDPDVRGDLLERIQAWNDLLAPDRGERFESVVFEGGWLVGDTTVDKMVAKTKDGKERIYYIDLDSGRLLRVDLYAQGWAFWTSVYFSDWREAGGLLRPYKVRIFERDKDKLLQTFDYESIRKS